LTPQAPLEVVNALYSDFLERGIRHFFPEYELVLLGPSDESEPMLRFRYETSGAIELTWCGSRYGFRAPSSAITENEMRLLGAIGDVLAARYRSIFADVPAASALHLFRGLSEDRYVSAFLDHEPYLDHNEVPAHVDVIARAIEVLRESSLITYENRRVSTGVLLLRTEDDPQPARSIPPDALPYNRDLIGIKSIHRLCDGIKTLFLVSHEGMLIDLIDIHEWSRFTGRCILGAPTAAVYHCHSVATFDNGHLCLVLTPNGEIKIFAGGLQVFNFLGGRWRLTDTAQKYHRWDKAVGDGPLAERIYRAALNMAENRRGALFVILDDPRTAGLLVANADLLDTIPDGLPHLPYTKDKVHYLLRNKHVLDLEPALLESTARMDGGIVMDREGHLLAFGAILHNEAAGLSSAAEGGRTTAAISASRLGNVLKVSEDGLVTYYRDGRAIWEI
jgi:hypothetical protein